MDRANIERSCPPPAGIPSRPAPSAHQSRSGRPPALVGQFAEEPLGYNDAPATTVAWHDVESERCVPHRRYVVAACSLAMPLPKNLGGAFNV